MKATYFVATGLMALAALVAGCDKPADTGRGAGGGTSTPTKPAPKEDEHDDDHDHGPGPHGGTIIEFGRYHGEFVVDHAKKHVTVYILSGNLKKNVPLKTDKLLLSITKPKFQVDLTADPQEGDPKGSSSRFIATHDNFGVEQEFAGTVSGEVDGVPYLGDFEEKPAKK